GRLGGSSADYPQLRTAGKTRGRRHGAFGIRRLDAPDRLKKTRPADPFALAQWRSPPKYAPSAPAAAITTTTTAMSAPEPPEDLRFSGGRSSSSSSEARAAGA